MRDLISRSALIEEIEKIKSDINQPSDVVWNNAVKNCVDTINEQPTVEAKPVVHGEWIEVKGVLSWFYKCSECGMFHEYKRKFCNGCGADMRGGKNE